MLDACLVLVLSPFFGTVLRTVRKHIKYQIDPIAINFRKVYRIRSAQFQLKEEKSVDPNSAGRGTHYLAGCGTPSPTTLSDK